MPRPPKPKRGRARRMDIDPKLPKTARKKEIWKAFSAKQTRQEREQTDGSDIDLVEDVEYKRGNDMRINIDPKLPKTHRQKTRRRITCAQYKEQENESTEESDITVEEVEEQIFDYEGTTTKRYRRGRPSLSSAGPMNEEQLKARKQELYRDKKEQDKKEEKEKQISESRKEAVNIRWEKEKERKKVHKIERCREELYGRLPGGFILQLDILSMVTPIFPDCSIESSRPCLTSRIGKSRLYESLASVKECLRCCPLANKLILVWACDLAQTEYEEFKSRGLRFRLDTDIPRELLIKEKADLIQKEVWGNTRRQDVRCLMLDSSIRVYKVC